MQLQINQGEVKFFTLSYPKSLSYLWSLWDTRELSGHQPHEVESIWGMPAHQGTGTAGGSPRFCHKVRFYPSWA